MNLKEHMKRAWSITFLGLALIFSLLCSGCSKKDQEATTNPVVAVQTLNKVGSCVDCHKNYEALKKMASPDTSSDTGGCGGDAPHIDPYDRVYLGGDGYTAFAASTHGKQRCTSCHGGIDSTENKVLAHSGNFIKHPSTQAETKCTPCHSTTSHFASSIHSQGWGQKSMVALRAGVSSFNDLPASMKNGYEVNCAKCHAGCGDCHVNRPKAGGGGLYKGHQFRKTPDMRDNCIACHTSRGGHAYLGIATGTVPDVHLTKLGNGHCLNCHNGSELHGDGESYDQRYKVAALPKCESCHSDLVAKNTYHAMHLTTFNCQTCHSQDYNNCGSCHIGGLGARVPSYQGFKIGINPIPQTKSYKYATLRQSLTAPDSWKEYGISLLAKFDVRPTYKYTTPHNIIRWTRRTKVDAGRSCFDNCHVIKEGTTYRNKNLYLFNSDLQSWEVTADSSIIVDGKLPASWDVR